MSASIHSLVPPGVVAGGRLTINGDGFDVAPGRLPVVSVGGHSAPLLRATSSSVTVQIPDGVPGGTQPVIVDGVDGATAFVRVGMVVATGVHQVDSPVFDRQGRLYATLSGGRGQETPVSVFRIAVDGSREAFASGIPNATSLALSADDVLHVSSRFAGAVYSVSEDGEPTTLVEDVGVACGLAFDSDGALYIGDRSGTIHRLPVGGKAEVFATLPGSIAAFHLAMSPEGVLHVTAPTLNSSDAVYRVSGGGDVTRWVEGFGRPQGVAFSGDGRLHVVEALAGASGLYRLTDRGERDLLVSGHGLIGVAFAPSGDVVVCSGDTIYRFDPF